MSHIAQRYGMPPEIDKFVDDGFLEVALEEPDKMTIEFRVPDAVTVDHRRRMKAYRVVWIHPDHNADFCHYYYETPGDMPNFYVEIRESEGPSEIVDDLETVDDLTVWLEDLQSTSISP
jgi:hypothetical protein